MKVISIIATSYLCVLLGAVSAIASLLRSSSESQPVDLAGSPETTGFEGATILLDHVMNSGDWDDEVLESSLVSAYNEVHHGDYSITASFLENKIELPEDDETSLGEGVASLDQDYPFYSSVSWNRVIYSEL